MATHLHTARAHKQGLRLQQHVPERHGSTGPRGLGSRVPRDGAVVREIV
jgi:hypothetical protein